ncbi:Ethylene-responsive transcription factor 11 [Capsicum baccatum]|uniref:Ethylene-responsive transcription factor 11 n=1 Tax=Capsicum baccatum TaxID=33114 RepID=A0A2G2XJI2_CAPBA|nr:Ethylene-responsive transcription factor 11 [Capsicum baccatum]
MRGVTYADECNTKRSLTGIWRQKNGRYAAVFTDRITRKKLWLGTFDTIEEASQAYRIRHKRVWLGTFDTVEEASQAYFNKKLELENEILNQQGNHIQQSLADVETFDTASVGTESTNERNVTASSLPTAKRCLRTIRRQQNGRYGAVITDQIRRKQVRLGTFDTVEEASQAYFSKKSELKNEKLNQQCTNMHTRSEQGPKDEISLIGIRRRKSGRYSAKITDPIKHKEVYLGTFDTTEQASQAYFNKKSEFEKLRQQRQTENIRKRNCDQIQQPVASLDTAASARARHKRTDSHITTPHMIGAYKSKTAGRYTSEIIHSITKKKIWLGTFGTAEEASHAFQSKKLEFQKLVKAKKQHCTQSKPEKLVNFKQGTAEETFHVNQSKKFDLQSSKDVELQSDIPTDSSAGKKQEEQEDDEDLWMGKWVQLPGDREVKFSLKLGLPNHR